MAHFNELYFLRKHFILHFRANHYSLIDWSHTANAFRLILGFFFFCHQMAHATFDKANILNKFFKFCFNYICNHIQLQNVLIFIFLFGLICSNHQNIHVLIFFLLYLYLELRTFTMHNISIRLINNKIG